MNIQLNKLIKDTQSALSIATNPYSFFNVKHDEREKLKETLIALDKLKNYLEIK